MTTGDAPHGVPTTRNTGSTGMFGAIRQIGSTARNVAEVIRFGGLDTGEQAAPFEVVAEQVNYRLRHYYPGSVPKGTRPVLLIPPLMLTADVWDISPSASAVTTLHEAGIDPWVVDFGDPSREPGGLNRTLTDHLLAVSDAVERVYETTGREVVMGGYSQGGMFVYQVAALRRGKHIDSLVTFGSPADITAGLPHAISPELVSGFAKGLLGSGLVGRGSLPTWAVRLLFNMISPMKTFQGRVQFLLALHDREALLPRERQRQFLESEGFTAWAGPAIAELLEQFIAHNRMVQGGFVVDGRLVTLADIETPVMSVVGTTDTLGHPAAVRAIRKAAPRAQVYELTLPVGHFGLVVGTQAKAQSWPAVVEWVRWRDGEADLPPNIRPAELVETSTGGAPGAIATALGQAVDLGAGATRLAFGTARRVAQVATGLVSEAPTQLPRLSRLGQLEPTTRISLGLLLDEQAHEQPQEVLFLFGDRGYRRGEVKYRVDSVVKGLISIGVRHGDRVGVLMSTRPSGFTMVAALNRLGATAVVLRSDGDPPREAALGQISWVVSDPEYADVVDKLTGVRWAVLGGGSAARELRPDVVDMERIDPEQVELPEWYRPNPQRAGDVAFVLFVGEGENIRAVRITNRRWAMSALGTASAAALRPGDTIYSLAPLYHSSALLVGVGGAIAAGARFAVASGVDPDTFWSEVRRYGASHISYTWTALRTVEQAPPNLAEQHHPIRMFLGSGMPSNLWRRVSERFPGTQILEFYASAEGAAILANVLGNPIGSMGKPLPGTPTVRLAAFDQDTRSLVHGADGLVGECAPGEVGLLLAQVAASEATTGSQLRGVFEAGDAWQSTGDLFRRDEHGEFWLVDPVSALVHTSAGAIAPGHARRAVEAVPAVDLAVAFGVPGPASTGSGTSAEVLVVAVTLREGATLTASELDRAFGAVPPDQRPSYVRIVSTIPVTTWGRPVWTALRQEGLPEPGGSRGVWRLDEAREHYREV